MQRALVRWKCEGLSEEDAYRPVLPASPLMTVTGLVSHMRWTEHCWFEVLFQDCPDDGAPSPTCTGLLCTGKRRGLEAWSIGRSPSGRMVS